MNKHTSLYYGNSMHSVFTPGDTLLSEKVPFDSLHIGDIIIVYAGQRPYVHRIVKISEGKITTFGDDNAIPDPILVTPDMDFSLVTGARTFHGKPYSAPGGRYGMLLFNYHQLKRKARQSILHRLKWMEKLAFWRLPASRKVIFKHETWFYCGKILVAKQRENSIVYLSLIRRFFFKVPQRVLDNYSHGTPLSNK